MQIFSQPILGRDTLKKSINPLGKLKSTSFKKVSISCFVGAIFLSIVAILSYLTIRLKTVQMCQR